MKIKIKKNELESKFKRKVQVIHDERLEKSFAYLDKEKILIFVAFGTSEKEFDELTKEIFKKLGGLKNGYLQAKK